MDIIAAFCGDFYRGLAILSLSKLEFEYGVLSGGGRGAASPTPPSLRLR
jgi:hypothetical protein